MLEVAQVIGSHVEKGFWSDDNGGIEFVYVKQKVQTVSLGYASAIKAGFLQDDDLKFFSRGTNVQKSGICFYVKSLVYLI